MKTYQTLNEVEFNSLIKDFKNHIKEIDVRALEMPLPMITIVRELEQLKSKDALLVTHHKVPQILLNDLSDDNLTIYLTQIQENLIQILFIKS